MTDLDKLKDFIMTAQVAAEQGECLMPNITDVLNEIERLEALSLHNVVGRGEQLLFSPDDIERIIDEKSQFSGMQFRRYFEEK